MKPSRLLVLLLADAFIAGLSCGVLVIAWAEAGTWGNAAWILVGFLMLAIPLHLFVVVANYSRLAYLIEIGSESRPDL